MRLSNIMALTVACIGFYFYARSRRAGITTTVPQNFSPYSPAITLWPELPKPAPWPVSSSGGSQTSIPTYGLTSEGKQMGADNFSQKAVDMVKSFEGFSPVPYSDANGWSIGYGHFMGTSKTMDSITPAKAEKVLAKDMVTAANAIRNDVAVPLTQNQFDALTSLVYNIGAGAFFNSTLLRLLNAGDYAGAAAEFPKWKKSQGVVLPALVARRAREKAVFEA